MLAFSLSVIVFSFYLELYVNLQDALKRQAQLLRLQQDAALITQCLRTAIAATQYVGCAPPGFDNISLSHSIYGPVLQLKTAQPLHLIDFSSAQTLVVAKHHLHAGDKIIITTCTQAENAIVNQLYQNAQQTKLELLSPITLKSQATLELFLSQSLQFFITQVGTNKQALPHFGLYLQQNQAKPQELIANVAAFEVRQQPHYLEIYLLLVSANEINLRPMRYYFIDHYFTANDKRYYYPLHLLFKL